MNWKKIIFYGVVVVGLAYLNYSIEAGQLKAVTSQDQYQGSIQVSTRR